MRMWESKLSNVTCIIARRRREKLKKGRDKRKHRREGDSYCHVRTHCFQSIMTILSTALRLQFSVVHQE
jgi:hypothetical protein